MPPLGVRSGMRPIRHMRAARQCTKAKKRRQCLTKMSADKATRSGYCNQRLVVRFGPNFHMKEPITETALGAKVRCRLDKVAVGLWTTVRHFVRLGSGVQRPPATVYHPNFARCFFNVESVNTTVTIELIGIAKAATSGLMIPIKQTIKASAL